MRNRQPDDRIHPRDLGVAILNKKRFAINLRPGVPYNACIEEADEHLRCWASYNPLDDRAAEIIDTFCTKTENGAFVWNDDVVTGPRVCFKGANPAHSLYRFILPQ